MYSEPVASVPALTASLPTLRVPASVSVPAPALVSVLLEPLIIPDSVAVAPEATSIVESEENAIALLIAVVPMNESFAPLLSESEPLPSAPSTATASVPKLTRVPPL